MNRYHELAKAKGWHDKPVSDARLGAMAMLIISEIAELVEELRRYPLGEVGTPRYDGAKPVGAWSELADIEIRCWDMAGSVGRDRHLEKDARLAEGSGEIGDLSVITDADEALNYWQRVIVRGLGEHINPAMVIGATRAFARRVGVDMEKACDAKHDYNQTRPQRHGGKLA